MTKEEKSKLKALLPIRWSATIAEKTDLSEAYVRRVMSGLASHVRIEKEALMLAKSYQSEISEVEKLKASIL